MNRALIGFCLLCGMLTLGVRAQELDLSEVPADLPADVRAPLLDQRAAILGRWDTFLQHRAAFVTEFAGTEVGTARAAQAEMRKAQLKQEADSVVDEADRFNASVQLAVQRHETAIPVEDPDSKAIIESFETMAGTLGWDEEKIARLHQSFVHLDLGREVASREQVRAAWTRILERNGDSAQAKAAAEQGHGPGFPSMGRQTVFQDCALFALANATHLPYGFVAARAAKLIGDSTWRKAEDRANPERILKDVGLNGGEVVMLAEIFGEAEVVKSTEFARVLSAGRRLLVNVVPAGGTGAHEVVISRTFTHNGETWFEMVNSHDDPNTRRYLSSDELNTIMRENGVAYRQDRNRTVPLLRDTSR
jgi:hypothetical protein